MGGITGVFGQAGLTDGGTSGLVDITLETPVAVTRGGTGGNTAAAGRGSLFTFTPGSANALGDMYYRSSVGPPGALSRIIVPTTNAPGQVLTLNASSIPVWANLPGVGPGVGIKNPLEDHIVAADHNITGVNQLQAVTVQLVNGPQNGNLTINSSGDLQWKGSAIGGSGGITSVFTRLGPAIVAEAGDYNASQVTNAVNTQSSYTDPTWLEISWNGGRLTGRPSTFPPDPHTHTAADITSGLIDVARLGTGTLHDNTHFLRGDGAWAIPPTGSPGTGGPQTPWESHIDANQFNLTNVARIGIGTTTPSTPLEVVGNAGSPPSYSQVVINGIGLGAGSVGVTLKCDLSGVEQDWFIGTGGSNYLRLADATNGFSNALIITPAPGVGQPCTVEIPCSLGIGTAPSSVYKLLVDGGVSVLGTIQLSNGLQNGSISVGSDGALHWNGAAVGDGAGPGGMPNPWTEDVDADRWNLLHVGQVSTQYLTFCNDVDPSIDAQVLNGRLDVSGPVNATAYFLNGVPFTGGPGGGQDQTPWLSNISANYHLLTDLQGLVLKNSSADVNPITITTIGDGAVRMGGHLRANKDVSAGIPGDFNNFGHIGINSYNTDMVLATGATIAPVKIALFNYEGPGIVFGIGVMSGAGYPEPAITFGAGIEPDVGTPQMVLTNTGKLGLGTIAPTARISIKDEVSPFVNYTRIHSDNLYLAKSRGTEAAPTSVQAGDYLGYIGFGGYVSGIGYADGTSVQTVVTGVTASGVVADLAFATSDGSSTSADERMRLTSAGDLHVHGNIYLPANAHIYRDGAEIL